MNCWSCKKEIPDAAEFCPHCEAQVEVDATVEERAKAKAGTQEILASLSPDELDELCEEFKDCGTGEEFVRLLTVGDCPKCGSSSTRNCEHDMEIEDLSIAHCLACGQLWCWLCDEQFVSSQHTKNHECRISDQTDLNDEGREDAD